MTRKILDVTKLGFTANECENAFELELKTINSAEVKLQLAEFWYAVAAILRGDTESQISGESGAVYVRLSKESRRKMLSSIAHINGWVDNPENVMFINMQDDV
jgi:hypothetical protein